MSKILKRMQQDNLTIQQLSQKFNVNENILIRLVSFVEAPDIWRNTKCVLRYIEALVREEKGEATIIGIQAVLKKHNISEKALATLFGIPINAVRMVFEILANNELRTNLDAIEKILSKYID